MTPALTRALKLTAACLELAVRDKQLSESTVVTITHEGESLGDFSIGQVLDIADAALRPADVELEGTR